MPDAGPDASIVYTTSGSAAIELALRAAGVKAGDRVLLPTYHCPTMVAPAARLGALPTFYPITQTGAPSADYVLGSSLADAKAMLIAHYFGFPQPLDELRQWCNDNGIALIEDFAHAFFSLSSTRADGWSKRFLVASLPKFFPVEEGGCLIAGREHLAPDLPAARSAIDELRVLMDGIETSARYGRMGLLSPPLRAVFAAKDFLRGHRRRIASPPDGLPASNALISSATESRHAQRRAALATRWIVGHADRDRIIRRRRRNYVLLAELVSAMPEVSALRPELPDHVVPYVFPLRVRSPEQHYRAMRARALPVFRWDIVWPGTPVIPGDAGLRWASEIVQIACHQDMSEQDIRQIVHIIGEIVAECAA